MSIDLSQSWEQFYRETEIDDLPWESHPFSLIKDLVKRKVITDGKLLDAGCGTGNQAIFLAEVGFQVTGVDISPTAITNAQMKAKKADVDIHFVMGDIRKPDQLDLPVDFDVVLDWEFMHGIPPEDRNAHINTLAEHLKPGGILILRVFSDRDPDNVEGRNESKASGFRYFFAPAEIKELYKEQYDILESYERMVEDSGKQRFFDEYVMRKKT